MAIVQKTSRSDCKRQRFGPFRPRKRPSVALPKEVSIMTEQKEIIKEMDTTKTNLRQFLSTLGYCLISNWLKTQL